MSENQDKAKRILHSFSQFRTVRILGGFLIVAILIFIVSRFFKKESIEKPKLTRPEVLEEGKTIKFSEGYPGLEIIKTAKIEKGSEFITVGAPARIIASITNSVTGGSKIVLFESPEINTLYAEYVHSRNFMTKSVKNLKRLNDMYKNLVATEKDIIEAEMESSNAKAELAESEGKLRALGFNPAELDKVRSNIVWLICDVPEADLQNITKGKNVKVRFSSFPGLEKIGIAEAVGDNVDPTTRTVKVRITMPNENQQFKPGMFAQVEFGDTVGSSFVIPFTAVFTVEGNAFVFVKKDPVTFEKRPVVLGNSDRSNVEVVQGLGWGEEVVVSGTLLLKGLSIGY